MIGIDGLVSNDHYLKTPSSNDVGIKYGNKPKNTGDLKHGSDFLLFCLAGKASTFRFIKIQVVSWKIAYESTGGNEKQWNEQISERLSIENCDDGKCKCLQ